MSESAIHPPKPVLCYRVGVAGTRDLSNADPGLAARIADFLDFVKDRVYAIWNENPACFNAKHHPRLILVSSMAKGVDLLVARLALERGYELHALLAFREDIFVAVNFRACDIEDRNCFGETLRKATVKLELDGDLSQPESNAYDAAGSILVNNSDVLLAIWDFGPGKGAGGTANSFGKAKETGVLVVRMPPDRPAGPFFHDEGVDRPYEELKPQIWRQIMPGITPGSAMTDADQDSVEQARREKKRLQRFYGECERRVDLSLFYKIANAIFSLSLPRLTFKLPPYGATADESWHVMSDETFTDSARDHFKPFDQWADGLAVFYANCMRSTVAVTLLLGAILLAYALAMKLWRPGIEQNGVFTILESISILLLGALAGFALWRDVHTRWLQYRMLSEFLRSAGLASAIGGLPLPQSRFHEEEPVSHTWVSFYFGAVVRSMGLLNATFDDAYLADFKQLLISRLNSQVEFHKRRRALYRLINRNVRRCGWIIFIVSILGAFVQIIDTLRPDIACEPPWNLSRHISNLSLVFPVFGAALGAFVSQESFSRLSDLSASIVRRLENIITQVAREPLKSQALRNATSKAIDEMMAEHEEWFTLYSLREIELPH